MINPEIKAIHVFEKDIADEFCISLVLDIGPKGVNGSDQFYATVGTALGIKKLFSDEAVIVCRGFLIVNNFDINVIREKIQSLIVSCCKESWEETARSINKYFPWEFDDYNNSIQ